MLTILVLEDDQGLNGALCRYLKDKDFEAIGCMNVNEAYEELDKKKIDMIISDIMMPEIDGFEFAQSIRDVDRDIPILFMTARDDFMSKERGYEIGIDDYMVKPIDFNEMLLRIKALLRRANIATNKKITIGNLIADENEVAVYVDGENVDITLKEFRVLFKLLSYPGKAFTRSQLIDEYSGYDSEVGLRTVDVMITNIRSKLKNADCVQIQTVRGLGYRMAVDEKR